MFTINCKGKIITLENPLVMGILNVTPDSFYQGHLEEGVGKMALMAQKMTEEGADIIDVGGQSTRPGSSGISADEELERVLPVIAAIHEADPAAIISVDTYYSKVAKAAVDAGASMVNDISGGNADPLMLSTVAALKVPFVCMHMKGIPANMQQDPQYENVTKEVMDFFIQQIEHCSNAGIADIIIDPGFGFGKRIDHNFSLLKNLSYFSILEKPLLIGISRKSTVYKTLGCTASEALNGTTVLNTLALNNGAAILRVHDVKEAREAITLFTAYKKTPQN